VGERVVRFTATPRRRCAVAGAVTSPTSQQPQNLSGWYWDFGDGAGEHSANPTPLTWPPANSCRSLPRPTATAHGHWVGPAVVVSLPARNSTPAGQRRAPLPVQFAGPANDSGGNASPIGAGFRRGAASAAQNPLHTYTGAELFAQLVVTILWGARRPTGRPSPSCVAVWY